MKCGQGRPLGTSFPRGYEPKGGSTSQREGERNTWRPNLARRPLGTLVPYGTLRARVAAGLQVNIHVPRLMRLKVRLKVGQLVPQHLDARHHLGHCSQKPGYSGLIMRRARVSHLLVRGGIAAP